VDIEEHVVAGTHMTCVTDHNQALAEAVGDCLSRVEQEASNAEFADHILWSSGPTGAA
jgi:hypothetical protein